MRFANHFLIYELNIFLGTHLGNILYIFLRYPVCKLSLEATVSPGQIIAIRNIVL